MLLKCVSYERDSSDISELADESLARKVVAKFGASWASMLAVLRLPCPKASELREIAARCCTLAMRADRLMALGSPASMCYNDTSSPHPLD